MQASSTVSPREDGQPRQCIPMEKNRGAVSGAISNTSPMMVFFSIFAKEINLQSFDSYFYYTQVNALFQQKFSCSACAFCRSQFVHGLDAISQYLHSKMG
jgi:hypothetical protein